MLVTVMVTGFERLVVSCGPQTFITASFGCGTRQIAVLFFGGGPGCPATSPLGPCAALRSKWHVTSASLQESFVRPVMVAVTAWLLPSVRANPFGLIAVTGVGVPLQLVLPEKTLSDRPDWPGRHVARGTGYGAVFPGRIGPN